MQDFADSIRTGKPTLVTLEDTVEAVKMGEAANRIADGLAVRRPCTPASLPAVAPCQRSQHVAASAALYCRRRVGAATLVVVIAEHVGPPRADLPARADAAGLPSGTKDHLEYAGDGR